LHLEENPLAVITNSYRLSCLTDRPYVRLETGKGQHLATLFVPSSAHRLAALDDCTELSDWHTEVGNDEILLWTQGKSSAWKNKRYSFRCFENRFVYSCELEGKGSLTEVCYFGGYLSARPRWGSGFFWSEQHFETGFNSEPYRDEQYHFAATEGSVIDLTGVPMTGKDGWFFTPPPYCFVFQKEDVCLAVGVEAEPSKNQYTDFCYQTQRSAFYLSLSFEGRTEVDGHYRLPAIGFEFAADPYDALAAHSNALRSQGLAATPKRTPARWWSEPIYCGWGSQCALAALHGGRAPDYATQENYEKFMAELEQHGVSPGIVVLDDKWQKSYGENEVDETKWPDLKGFIKRQHEAGRKVLLWLKAWDPEGLPSELCGRNGAGVPVAVDATHPGFEERFRASIRRMLSPQGYDADGIKLDFSARIPASPGLTLSGKAWGLELMKQYLGILYSEAKTVKDDALIMTHTPHPYLADVLDMIRLNDINIGTDVLAAMRHRAKVAKIACPTALIDTDNWPITDKATWRTYTALQPELGVPSLYFATHIDSTREPLEEDDYALIRDSWRRYAERR
jgi:hypothetical protein